MAKWTAARRKKFKATMAGKRGRKVVGHVVTTSIPLDAIPARPARAKRPEPTRAPSNLQLALEVVRLLRSIIEH